MYTGSRYHLIVALATTLTLFVTQCIRRCSACSPSAIEEKTISQQVESTPLVLYGRVLRTMDLPHLSYDGGQPAYKAEMVVYCSLKKPVDMEISAVLNITEVGFIPGHCFMTTLERGKDYIVLVRVDHDGQLKPAQSADAGMEATATNIREVHNTCGLVPEESVVSQQLLDAGMDPTQFMKPCFDVKDQASCGSTEDNQGGDIEDPIEENQPDVTGSPENNSSQDEADDKDPDSESENTQKTSVGSKLRLNPISTLLVSTVIFLLLLC